MKTNALLFTLMMALAFTIACSKKSSDSALGSKMKSYTIDGDTVHVNNKVCAVSGSDMKDEDLGKWTSTVEYTGDIKKFKNKKIVFNQCCDMCIERFPHMWELKSEEIMKRHGLTN